MTQYMFRVARGSTGAVACSPLICNGSLILNGGSKVCHLWCFFFFFFFQRRPTLSTNDSVPHHGTICTPKRAFFAVALPSSSPFLRVFLCYIAVFTRRVGALKTGALQFTGVATNPSPSRAPGGWNRGRKKADGACCERRPGGSNVVRVGAGPAFWRAVFLPLRVPTPGKKTTFGAPVLSTGAWLVFAPLSPWSTPPAQFRAEGFAQEGQPPRWPARRGFSYIHGNNWSTTVALCFGAGSARDLCGCVRNGQPCNTS